MAEGYIKLWRSSIDSKSYYAEPFTRWQAWIDLLLLANYQDNVVYVRGIPVELKRGQVLAAEEFLASRWQWSRGKVRRYLDYLSGKTVQQIVQQKSRVVTVITIVNWEKYQGDSTTDGTTNSTTDGQQTDILKKDKNIYIKEKNKEKKTVEVPDWIDPEVWSAFIEMRTKIKAPLTERAKGMIIEKLRAMWIEGDQDPNSVLKQSIERSWRGIFPLKDQPVKTDRPVVHLSDYNDQGGNNG